MGIYFVLPALSASIAVCLICCGVSKSGSPAVKPITPAPAALSAFTLALRDKVAEGLIFLARGDNRFIACIVCTCKAYPSQPCCAERDYFL